MRGQKLEEEIVLDLRFGGCGLTLVILQCEGLQSTHTMDSQQLGSWVICVCIHARGIQETMDSCVAKKTTKYCVITKCETSVKYSFLSAKINEEIRYLSMSALQAGLYSSQRP
jgi:hypothetical protein